MRQVKIYNTKALADVAIMQFYAENKKNITKVYPAYKSCGLSLNDGTKIYFKCHKTISNIQIRKTDVVTYH